MKNRLRSFMQHLSLLIFTVAFSLLGCNTTAQMLSSMPTQPSQSPSLAEKNYIQLNDALKIYQAAAQHPWTTLPVNKLLKLGSKNINVALLRERLQSSGDLPTMNDNNIAFDSVLAQAVKSFQLQHGLKPDGIVGEATFAELNVSPEDRIKQIQINMSRWAKLNGKLGNRFILVNIPDYQMVLIDNNLKVLSMKAIVGKPTRQTPELYSRVTRVILNPSWHVPTKIAKKDLLPKIQQDPDYFDDMNIHVIEQIHNKPTEVNSDDIDWDNMSENQDMNLDFRQDPGEKNALGAVKFEFPNDVDVYMHDTPAKNLFDSYTRDFSSGCIRLEKPFDLVSYLMKDNENWDNDRIQEVVQSKKTTFVRIMKPIPIIITYITAWVDDNGKVNFRNDIYHRDQ